MIVKHEFNFQQDLEDSEHDVLEDLYECDDECVLEHDVLPFDCLPS